MSDAQSDPLRHHGHLTPDASGKPANVMGDSFMERMSERVASGMGTVPFIVGSTLIIVAWMLVNHLDKFVSDSYHGLQSGKGFDPAPFILLNLVFSAVAFFTGALVIIAAKASAKRDRATALADAQHREELAQTQLALLKTNTDLTEQIHALIEQNKELTEQVHNSVCAPGR